MTDVDPHIGVLLRACRPWECLPVQKQPPSNMTAEQLSEHLRLLDVASRDDLDELLTDLLCHVYGTLASQNG